jgi:hypothetical protein
MRVFPLLVCVCFEIPHLQVFERRNDESVSFRTAKPKPYTGTYYIGRKKKNYCPI